MLAVYAARGVIELAGTSETYETLLHLFPGAFEMSPAAATNRSLAPLSRYSEIVLGANTSHPPARLELVSVEAGWLVA